MRTITLFLLVLLTIGAKAQNTLTKEEKKAGWQLLFDGKSLSGWHKFNGEKPGPAWKVQDGALVLDKTAPGENDGDIITDAEYGNYEFTYEWKIDKCGNSGVMFNVVEDKKYKASYFTGPEMQVLDNECHPDAKIIKHRAGDLYDLISSSTETVKPAGEWNQASIVSIKGHYAFFLNGTKVVEFDMHTPAWDELVKASKFKTWPDFGKATKGHFALQDHGNKVWFRNMKIKELK